MDQWNWGIPEERAILCGKRSLIEVLMQMIEDYIDYYRSINACKGIMEFLTPMDKKHEIYLQAVLNCQQINYCRKNLYFSIVYLTGGL